MLAILIVEKKRDVMSEKTTKNRIINLIASIAITAPIGVFANSEFCTNNNCIDLSISELESIAQKTSPKGNEFFYVSESENSINIKFFANIPKVQNCNIVPQYYAASESPASKPSMRISTTTDCFNKYKSQKAQMDNERLWNDSAKKETKELNIESNINEADLVLIRKNSSFISTEIPELAWHTPEAFKLVDLFSDSDHFIYSESLLALARKEIQIEENINKLIAELGKNTKSVEACIRTKKNENIATARNAIDLLYNDLESIFSLIATEQQETALTELENRIIELENLLEKTETELTQTQLEEELEKIENEIKNEKHADNALRALDKLEAIARKNPEKRNEIAALQKHALSRAVRVSTSEDYIYVLDALDKYSHHSIIEEKFTHNLIAETFNKANEDGDLNKHDAKEILDRSKEMTVGFQGNDEKLFDKFFDITLQLTDTVYLKDETTDKSKNEYTKSLAQLNKDTKSKKNDVIIDKISEVYAHDLSAESIASMNKNLADLKKQKYFKDEDLFNIYRNTATNRMSVLNNTGNITADSLGQVHGLMIGLSDTVTMNSERTIIFNQDMINIAQAHIPMLVNSLHSDFNYYYTSYKTHMENEWNRLSKEKVSAQKNLIAKRNDNTAERNIDRENITEIDKRLTGLQQNIYDLEKGAQTYPVLARQAQLEAQQKALEAQKLELERWNHASQHNRAPGVSTGPGIQLPQAEMSKQQPTIINNPSSFMNGVIVQPMQIPKVTGITPTH